jgi:hypothetical protein
MSFKLLILCYGIDPLPPSGYSPFAGGELTGIKNTLPLRMQRDTEYFNPKNGGFYEY